MLVYLAVVWAFAFLCDDAFISFRYARNLSDGHGPVFNVGERVEGYTNFSWVLIIAAAMRLGFSPESVSLALGVVAGGCVLIGSATRGPRDASQTTAETSSAFAIALLPPAALAVNRSFAAWSTGGLETMLFTALVFFALSRFAAEREAARAGAGSALLLAAAALTRPEGALFAALCAAFFVRRALQDRSELWRFAQWLCVLAPLPLLHLAWRLVYYGDWVPNTFRAKVSGLWFEQGGTYLFLFAREHSFVVLLPFLALALTGVPRLRTRLFAAATLLFGLYVAAVGGDRFEFRFLVPVLPLLAVWLGDGLLGFHQQLRGFALGPHGRSAATVGAAALIVAALGLPTLRGFQPSDGLASVETMRAYAERRSEEGRALAMLVQSGLIPADTHIAVTGAGALPYYAMLPTLDIHGLSDAEVARQALQQRGVIAHEKRASPELLAERGIEIVDVRNRILETATAATPPSPAQLELLLRPHAQRAPLTLRAIYAGERLLVFATTLGDAEFRSRFAHTRILR